MMFISLNVMKLVIIHVWKTLQIFSGKDYLLVERDSMDSSKNTIWSYDVGGEKV